jgi:hypothetical protein
LPSWLVFCFTTESKQSTMSQTGDAKHEDEIQYGSMGVTREELEEKSVFVKWPPKYETNIYHHQGIQTAQGTTQRHSYFPSSFEKSSTRSMKTKSKMPRAQVPKRHFVV